jgi:plasmid stabilization system protein ParE
VFDYVLARDPRAARRPYNAIRNRVALLAEQPALGRPGRVAGTRELVIGGTPYIVAYTTDHAVDAVVVLRVLHGARRWPDKF